MTLDEFDREESRVRKFRVLRNEQAAIEIQRERLLTRGDWWVTLSFRGDSTIGCTIADSSTKAEALLSKQQFLLGLLPRLKHEAERLQAEMDAI